MKKAHLPSADLEASLWSDAIQRAYAQLSTEGIPGLRANLLVQRIDPSRYPQVSGYNGRARPLGTLYRSEPPRPNVLLKYASARRSLSRLASGTFLTGLKTVFFRAWQEVRANPLTMSCRLAPPKSRWQ